MACLSSALADFTSSSFRLNECIVFYLILFFVLLSELKLIF
ncbi:hypothetical protein GbCGDNIH6_8290 [Granulibacter bethesdensis]|nr:hypothetical protein GbCGDNIH6_8290 [Granulibacter bethesdensis]